MTRRNALLLGAAGIIFTILMTSVEVPELLRQPTLIQIQDSENIFYDFKDFAYSRKERFPIFEQPYLFSSSKNNEGDSFQSKIDEGNKRNPSLFEYRPLKNSRSFLFSFDKEDLQNIKDAADSKISIPDLNESDSNLLWVEVGDDPASLEDAYPKGVVQFYTRPLNPLFTSDQRQPKDIFSQEIFMKCLKISIMLLY